MAEDPKKPRAGSMSGDDRDAAALKRQRAKTSPVGVPIHVPDPEDLTPVTQVVARIEQTMTLNEREQVLVHLLCEHMANNVMRHTQAVKQLDASKLREELNALNDEVEVLRTKTEVGLADVRGERGDNGKLGELKRRVDQLEGRRWWLMTFIAGTIITVLGSAIAFGRWMGSIDADIATLKARSYRAQPFAPASGKGTDTP